LASILDKCRTGKTKRLIINLPPRTLKSHVASVAFAAWLLGHDPSKQIICASYGQDLADKHARDCRTLMGSSFYRELFPRTVLAHEKQAVEDFMTTARGFRMATSIGGVLTGRGADVIILDDVMKPEDALSEAKRKGVLDWYSSSLVSRLNSKDHGIIIIVMQRLHQEDLVGELTKREPWEVLSLPAIALEDECFPYLDIWGSATFERKEGEALHPERDSVESYRKIREVIGEYNFLSQYQQKPTSREGNVIKTAWLQYYEHKQLPNPLSFVLQSWDTASKVGELNDFSVCTTWGLHNGRSYLINVYRERLTFPELLRAAHEQHRQFSPNKVVIEDRASGTALIQELNAAGVYGVQAYQPPPERDKYFRLDAHSPKFEHGDILLPSQAPWLDEYVRELTGFPGTKHDDQVDSTTQALEFLAPESRSLAFWDAIRRLCPPYVRETW
jgi:predicted phage terminase large subunit-like protein